MPRLEDLPTNPGPTEALTRSGDHQTEPRRTPTGLAQTPAGATRALHRAPEAQETRAQVDLSQDLRTRLAQGGFVADGGPWVQHREAAAVEAGFDGRPAGPLDHTILAVKDLVAVAGLRLGAGTRARAEAPPEPRDAFVVSRLAGAGAVVAGTVALHELAFGVTGVNDQVGFPAHPIDRQRIPGGSSSGSAVAVAQGLADLALGTDTGGSVRIPAALCGVVGFKPSRGRYPLDGVLALAPSLDHVGLLARRVDDIVSADAVLTNGAVPQTVPSDAAQPAEPWRLGVDRISVEAADPAVAAAIETALSVLGDAGHQLVDLAPPEPGRVVEASTTILLAEAAAVHRRLLAEAEDRLGPDIATRLRSDVTITSADYAAAITEGAELTAATRAALDTVDAMIRPTVPILAPTIDVARSDPTLTPRLVSGTRLGNLTGLPALSLPVGGAELPVGLQIIGTSDERVLRLGLALQPLLSR